jgi:hypothetical protein
MSAVSCDSGGYWQRNTSDQEIQESDLEGAATACCFGEEREEGRAVRAYCVVCRRSSRKEIEAARKDLDVLIKV